MLSIDLSIISLIKKIPDLKTGYSLVVFFLIFINFKFSILSKKEREMIMTPQVYSPKNFNLSGLKGISDETLEVHFKLYEGYVKNTNLLNEQIAEQLEKNSKQLGTNLVFTELKRRLGFEYNGMVLHEYYFENLKPKTNTQPKESSSFITHIEKNYGDYDTWKNDFTGVGEMRGVGWAICLKDPTSEKISNHWISLHETGPITGYEPILVMDVWEHAFLLDYKPAERSKYIEAFFSNICWDTVEKRIQDFKARAQSA